MRTTRRGIAGAVLLTGGALATVLLSGCQGDAGAAASATPAPPATAPLPSPPPVHSTVPSAAPPAAPPPVLSCVAANLRLGLGPTSGAAGHVYQAVDFTNSGSTPCNMAGFPGVAYVTGAGGPQIGAPAVEDGLAGPAVTLAPGQVAHALIDFVQVGVFDESTCQPTPAGGINVIAPDDTTPRYLARPGTGCAGHPQSPQLQVQAVQAGA